MPPIKILAICRRAILDDTELKQVASERQLGRFPPFDAPLSRPNAPGRSQGQFDIAH